MGRKIQIRRDEESQWVEIWGIADGPETFLISQAAEMLGESLAKKVSDLAPGADLICNVKLVEVD